MHSYSKGHLVPHDVKYFKHCSKSLGALPPEVCFRNSLRSQNVVFSEIHAIATVTVPRMAQLAPHLAFTDI